MNAIETIILARKRVDNNPAMESSARQCLADAIELYDAGDFEYAKKRAIQSLKYSVGVFSSDYARATK